MGALSRDYGIVIDVLYTLYTKMIVYHTELRSHDEKAMYSRHQMFTGDNFHHLFKFPKIIVLTCICCFLNVIWLKQLNLASFISSYN